MGLVYLYKRKHWNEDAVMMLTLLLVAVETALNLGVSSIPTTSRTAYVKDNEDTIQLAGNIKCDTFYRVEKGDSKTKNDGAWMNYPSASLFSSVANASLSDFVRYLGCESSTNAYSIKGSTPLVDSLFSIRYGIYPDQLLHLTLKHPWFPAHCKDHSGRQPGCRNLTASCLPHPPGA